MPVLGKSIQSFPKLVWTDAQENPPQNTLDNYTKDPVL